MRYVKWTFITLLALLFFAVFHYTLPQRDIVRIADTYEKRVDPGENSLFWSKPDSGNATLTNRDVFFIQAIQTSDKVMVYRNEDTGWGWPPYFKFDTSNLQAEAADLKSTKETPRWAVIKHYGWRNEFMSIYPNAVSVRAIDDPEIRLIPWFNIVILIFIGLIALRIHRSIQRFRARRIDPLIEDAGEAWDKVEDGAQSGSKRIRNWLNSWRKPR